MPFKVEGEARVAFTNAPGQVPSPPDNGEIKVQQADGALITRKSDGTTRVTDIRGIADQIAAGPLATAFGLKADLVSGRVPLSQLPPGFGGGPTTVTASQITDATAFGRGILTGTRDTTQAALGLGTAAYRQVGVSGGVAAFDDPRFGSSGGGGAPSTVTASQISDSSATGRVILTGTPAQARTALDNPIDKAVIVSPALVPNWADHRVVFDRVRVPLNNPSEFAWPGGGHYGTTSALTGVARIPAEIETSFDGSSPTVIINAGIMGLIETVAINTPAVGVFGMARAGKTQAQVWGGNLVAGNKLESIGGTAFNCQMNGLEIDCAWYTPPGGPAGSNMIALFAPAEFYGSRPDGNANLILSRRIVGGTHGWRELIFSDHGAADTFAQIGMAKGPDQAGASGSQPFHFITSNGGQKTSSGDTNDYRHSYFSISPNGDMVFQPNYFGTPGSVVVGNNNLGNTSRMHPTEGFVGPRGAFTTLGVGGEATISGNLTAGNVFTSTVSAAVVTATGNITTSSSVVGSNLQATGAVFADQNIIFRGKTVAVSASGTAPSGYGVLMVPL